MEVNKKYYIKLTAVTPLSVGAGNEAEWVKGADYVIKDNKVYILDLHRVAEEGIDLNKLSELFLVGNHEGIVNILGGKIDNVAMYVFDLPCSTENNIKAFERSQMHDLPVVAGSSLKGAIRSVLFNYLRDNEQKNEDVFGTMKEGTDFMRFIKIGDIEMPETELFNTKIFNLHGSKEDWKGGWKHALKEGTSDSHKSNGFNTIYECVAPGVSGIGSVMFGKQQLKLLLKELLRKNLPDVAHGEKKRQIINGGIKELFAIINGFTRNYLLKEKAFFEKYPAERTGQVLDSIDYLLRMIPEDDSFCLLKMSAGVGFHTITGDWQYDDYSRTGLHVDGRNAGKQKYKSRKIAEQKDGLSLMGFVKLSVSTENEYTSYVDGLNATCTHRLQVTIDKKAQAEAEAEAKKQEFQKKENDYVKLLSEAKTAEDAGNYREAISKAEEAHKIFENRPEPDDIIIRNRSLASQQELAEAKAAKKAIEEAARNDKYGRPLAEVLAYSKYTSQELLKWTKVETNVFKENEYSILFEVLKPLDVKQLKVAIKSKKDVIKAIGDEYASRLFAELGLK